MAKGWIKGATANSHGQFRAKAERAGETTRHFAAEHKGDAGVTGKQARLALTLSGMHHKPVTRNKPASLFGKG
jgi:hypothetical protein